MGEYKKKQLEEILAGQKHLENSAGEICSTALPKCPSPCCAVLARSVYQQVHGPSVHEPVLAMENEKVRAVVYFLGEQAPAAGFDLSSIRQLNKAFPNFNTCWRIQLTLWVPLNIGLLHPEANFLEHLNMEKLRLRQLHCKAGYI